MPNLNKNTVPTTVVQNQPFNYHLLNRSNNFACVIAQKAKRNKSKGYTPPSWFEQMLIDQKQNKKTIGKMNEVEEQWNPLNVMYGFWKILFKKRHDLLALYIIRGRCVRGIYLLTVLTLIQLILVQLKRNKLQKRINILY